MVIAAPTRTDAEVDNNRFARPTTASYVGIPGLAPIGETPLKTPTDNARSFGEIPCLTEVEGDEPARDRWSHTNEQVVLPSETATPPAPASPDCDRPSIELTWQSNRIVLNELDGGFDDTFEDFEEDDFDDEFDDDFEEEVEGEYELQDDEYGNEFGEFGEGPIGDFDDEDDESSPDEAGEEDSD